MVGISTCSSVWTRGTFFTITIAHKTQNTKCLIDVIDEVTKVVDNVGSIMVTE